MAAYLASMVPSVLILIRRGESPAKCTVRPLRGTPGLEFRAYPLKPGTDLSRHLLLAPDAPPLSPADGTRPLLLLDASWRHALRMRNNLGPLEARSIPGAWKTAYPRNSKIHADPASGLATVEALYAALLTLGHRDESLLRFYAWRDAFLKMNELVPLEFDSVPKPVMMGPT